MPRIRVEGECWLWTGYRLKGGYGQIKYRNRSHLAHRIAYELVVGPIPAGMTIDHLCRIPACLNPSHLEPVSMRENILRGMRPEIIAHRAGTCLRGHPQSPENMRFKRDGSVSQCRICERERKATA